MYTLATQMAKLAKGSSIADKVIGRGGAAILCKSLDVKEVYGKLISDNAMEILEESNIVYYYDNICDYIKIGMEQIYALLKDST